MFTVLAIFKPSRRPVVRSSFHPRWRRKVKSKPRRSRAPCVSICMVLSVNSPGVVKNKIISLLTKMAVNWENNSKSQKAKHCWKNMLSTHILGMCSLFYSISIYWALTVYRPLSQTWKVLMNKTDVILALMERMQWTLFTVKQRNGHRLKGVWRIRLRTCCR